MKLTLSSKLIYLELDTELQGFCVEKGLVTFEELLDVRKEYDEFVAELETEWPPERLKTWLLEQYRSKCEWALKRKKFVESENREARRKGMSYVERQKYAKDMAILTTLFTEWRSKGLKCKHSSPSIRQFVRPTDAEVILSKGAEEVLKYAIM